MKKIITVNLLLGALFLTACASQPIEENQNAQVLENSSITNANFVFDDEAYTLTLPGDYQIEPGAEYGFIMPKITNNFPSIKLGLMASKENPSSEAILKDEKAILTNLCNQTEGCGTITESKTVEIGGKTALKFTVQYKGRGVNDPNGYINEYHYSVPHIKYEYDAAKYPQDQNLYPQTYIYQFSIAANDQESPKQQEAMLDSIIKTIEFK
ncbi:hypothetical protein IPJ72_02435 [Candidatus Peregrinibacteria bacterium]|nr:MAG: hypothetical protein IPJ72_02435 [Candidatus Peregrinibacteria bacterium]